MNTVNSLGDPWGSPKRVAVIAGFLSSLIADLRVRSAAKNDILPATIQRLPLGSLDSPLVPALVLRVLRLNCVTAAFAEFWESCWEDGYPLDVPTLRSYSFTAPERAWNGATPFRRAADRRNALVEIDALVALILGVEIEDLCTAYRTNFSVLYGYDQSPYTYDRNGRLVPNPVLTVWRRKGDTMTAEERTFAHPGSGIDYVYELPYGTLDREADMRTAYAEFERRLAEKVGGTA